MLKLEEYRDVRILYVEDDLKAFDAMIKIFKKFFKHIDTAHDGLDGLEKIKSNDYDLIITDINMPKMSGLEMISNMKEIGKNIYTIMLTAYSDNNTFAESVRLGVQGYAIKPINVTQFVETLSTAVTIINASKENKVLEQYKNIMVSKTNKEGFITFVNDKFCEMSGFSKEELLGNTHGIMKHNSTKNDTFVDMWSTITSRNIWVGKIQNIKKDGTSYHLDTTICPIVDDHGEIVEYIALRNDISSLLNPELELENLVDNSLNPILVMLKIDNLHTLEHIYSKQIIDDMLDLFGRMLFTYLPENLNIDKIINFGKGSYVLFTNNEQNLEIDIKEYESLLKDLQQTIEQSILVVDDFDFDISVLVSFVTKGEELIENVKYGLEVAIEENKTLVCANDLTKIAKEYAIEKTKVIKMIQTAINNNKIVSYFQPITNNKTKEVEKYESLVRLETPEGKILSPYFFLDIAKESGYYTKITNIVLENSFKALSKTDKEISINLSAIDIENRYIRDKIYSLLKTHSSEVYRIVFELLEDEKVKDFELVKDFITKVKSYGVQVAIDDFGAGVSNFERLLDYQPDILKIDACLIKNIDKDKYSKDVVETIQIFAWKQDIKTVAEFVETQEILKTVTDIGINYTQGYLLGKPDLLENHINKSQ